MDTIAKGDFTTIIGNVTLTKVCSVKPDSDSEESKQVTVNMKYDGLTLGDVFQKALKTDIISAQQMMRKKFDTLTSTMNINASKPGATQQMTAKEQFKADAIAAGVDLTDRKAALEFYEEWINE